MTLYTGHVESIRNVTQFTGTIFSLAFLGVSNSGVHPSLPQAKPRLSGFDVVQNGMPRLFSRILLLPTPVGVFLFYNEKSGIMSNCWQGDT